MKFSISFALVALSALGVTASPSQLVARQNANRGVPNGGCCFENRSLKQDVCRVNGQVGRCVPDFINGCGTRLTCIPQSQLVCNPRVLERGRPLCRRRGQPLVL